MVTTAKLMEADRQAQDAEDYKSVF